MDQGRSKEKLTIFTGIDRMSDDDLRMQVAIFETYNLGNITGSYINKAKKNVSKKAGKMLNLVLTGDKKTDKGNLDVQENVGSLEKKLEEAVRNYEQASRPVLMERLLHNFRLRAGYDRSITNKYLISQAVVDKAAKYLNIEDNLSQQEKIESVYRRYLERVAEQADKLLATQNEEQARRMEEALEQNISMLSDKDKEKMKVALHVNELTGAAVRKSLISGGGVAGVIFLTGQFGAYMAAVSILHAIVTVGMGIVLPFGVYAGLAKGIAIMGGPIGWLAMLGISLYNLSAGSDKIDGELLSQAVYFARASYGRSYSAYSLDNVLEGMLERSQKRIHELEHKLQEVASAGVSGVVLDRKSYMTIEEAKQLIREKCQELQAKFEDEKRQIRTLADDDTSKQIDALKKQYTDKLQALRQSYMDNETQKVRECKALRDQFEAIKQEKQLAEESLIKQHEHEIREMQQQFSLATEKMENEFAEKEKQYQEIIKQREKIIASLENDLNNLESTMGDINLRYKKLVEYAEKTTGHDFNANNDPDEIIEAIENALHPVLENIMSRYESDISQIKADIRSKYSFFNEEMVERLASSQFLYTILLASSKGGHGLGQNATLSAALYPSIVVAERALKKIIKDKWDYVNTDHQRQWTIGSMIYAINAHSGDWRPGFGEELKTLKDIRNDIMHGDKISEKKGKTVLGLLFDKEAPRRDVLVYLNHLIGEYRLIWN